MHMLLRVAPCKKYPRNSLVQQFSAIESDYELDPFRESVCNVFHSSALINYDDFMAFMERLSTQYTSGTDSYLQIAFLTSKFKILRIKKNIGMERRQDWDGARHTQCRQSMRSVYHKGV